jgi:Methane oxygenase PmoA
VITPPDFVVACLNMAPVSPARGPIAAFRPCGVAWRLPGLALPVILLATLSGCASRPDQADSSRVEALRTDDGVQLVDGGAPVLFYRSRASAGREPWRTHYVHPVHSIGGAVITEDAPADHVHHRGLFWAWRRILVDGVKVADGWVGDNLVLDVAPPTVTSHEDGSAQIDVRARWIVPMEGQPTPIIEETSSIRAYLAVDGRRRIDVLVGLQALRRGVELAGTDDEKGYGGLSLRVANPQLAGIESGGRILHATVAAMQTADWVAFSWRVPPPPWPARIAASCQVDGHAWTRWVLRQEPSMQNCAFPGAAPTAVPRDRVLRLGLSLLVE